VEKGRHYCREFWGINDSILRNWGTCVDTVFGHVSMVGKSIDQQNKAVVFYLQDELPMRMVADEGGVERD
jgi:hypothetical protein